MERQAGHGPLVGLVNPYLASPIVDPSTTESEWGHIGSMVAMFDLCPACLRKAYAAVGITSPTVAQMIARNHQACHPSYGGRRHLSAVPSMPSPIGLFVDAPVVTGSEETPLAGQLSPDDLRELARNGALSHDDLRAMGVDPDPQPPNAA